MLHFVHSLLKKIMDNSKESAAFFGKRAAFFGIRGILWNSMYSMEWAGYYSENSLAVLLSVLTKLITVILLNISDYASW